MVATKKNAKATKKFEKKHLKGVLERRKDTAKIKQRQQIKTKKQAKRAKDAEFYKGSKEDSNGAATRKQPDANVSSMSVDEFFQDGFNIIGNDKGKTKEKSARGKLGKRKRDVPKRREEASDSESELEILGQGDAVVSDAGDESADEADDHAMSKGTMDALAEKDPEFYKYLKENDPEALEFDEDAGADLAEVDELSSGEEEEQPKKKRKKAPKKSAESEGSDEETAYDNELTRNMVSAWKKSMAETQSLRAARQAVLAFRSAAHLNEDDDGNKQRYCISNPDVFHDILIVALKQVPEVLQHHVPVKESASGKVRVATDSRKFKNLSILMRTFTSAILHLLGTLTDDATLKLTINALTPLLPYLLSFRKVLKNLIKTVVSFWSNASSSDSTRITAFLVIRRLMVIGDKGIRETILKATYQGLIQGTRSTNVNTIEGINLMKNSAAELWGIDQGIGYTTAFTFIRQLAIHLRNSIAHNQNESYKKVYNWQYVHSLDFWSCVLSEHCSSLKEAETGKESQLRPLIYPLVQVTLGAMRLIPTAIYFPLRFQLFRSLLRISRATGTYIPLASMLLEVLNSAEMKKAPKGATLKQFDFNIAYKAPKSYLKTRVYQDGVGDQVVDLFSEYFVLWATNIAFPEFSLPVIIMLKRWLKDVRKRETGNKNARLTSAIVLLVQKLEANGKFIEGKRAKVDFAPKDRSQVDAFLKDFDWEKTPLGAYVVTQRKLKADKLKMMEEARKEDERKRREDEKKALEDQHEESDDDGDEDDDEDGVMDVDDEEELEEDEEMESEESEEELEEEVE